MGSYLRAVGNIAPTFLFASAMFNFVVLLQNLVSFLLLCAFRIMPETNALHEQFFNDKLAQEFPMSTDHQLWPWLHLSAQDLPRRAPTAQAASSTELLNWHACMCCASSLLAQPLWECCSSCAEQICTSSHVGHVCALLPDMCHMSCSLVK